MALQSSAAETLPARESLTVEFKSDSEGGLPARIVAEAVVGLTNAEGGMLCIGINDDGTVSGVRSQRWRDPDLAAAYIASHTIPPVAVTAELMRLPSFQEVLVIRVPKSAGIVAANDGKILKRRIKIDGTPETSPLFPQEFLSRLSEIGRCDFSAMSLPNTSCEDLDSSQRERLRRILRDSNGESALLDLKDDDLDKALGLVRETQEGSMPTVAGLLILGKAERLKRLLPGAGAVFQHLSGTDVLANDDIFAPLLQELEALLDRFKARNSQIEVMQGLTRTAIPTFSEQAFREALVNAFCHRDYTVMNRISVRLSDDGLEITSPGGFVSGVGLDNLLTAEPRPRNALLSDIFKRIGLAERTGRGIDRIFEENLRYGRWLPDYSESGSDSVRVFFLKCDPDLNFLNLILNCQRETGRRISIYGLMVLSAVFFAKKIDLKGIISAVHLPELRVQRQLESLLQDGLLETRGSASRREYVMGPKYYETQQSEEGHIRGNGSSSSENEERILQLARSQGTVTRGDVTLLLGSNAQAAYRLLRKLVTEGKLVREGDKRKTVYRAL